MNNFFIQLEDILKNQPAYRIKQIKQAIFVELIDSWDKAMTLSKDLRSKLAKKLPLAINAQIFESKDKATVKALMTLTDGLKIETVLMRHGDKRNTVCVSSQVGCPLGCKFCATGAMGFKRNLETWEIVSQVLFFARYLKKQNARVDNVVFMGMGEPFLNYDNVMEAIRILNDPHGLAIGIRHFSISTIGITEGIEKLANEKLQVNLAISLHAPNDKIRNQIIPIGKKYSIRKILKAVDDYIAKTNRKVMFEYLLIKNLNDSDEFALKLAKLMKKPLYFVNLITYNKTGGYQPPTTEKIKHFKKILEENGVFATLRYRFGADIEAACGQLAAKSKNHA
jgi:23S rRNA (adenine2503-C2)-methyltransferase